MRSTSLFCARLALFAGLAGCNSNAVPGPTEDAVTAPQGELRAARPAADAEAEGTAQPLTREGAPTAEALAAAPLVSAFRGKVEGHTLTPTYNFFMRGRLQVAGEPDVLILVQTDHPDLCAHLGAGTMPRDATMFAVALMQEEGGPLAARGKFLAPLDRGPDAPRHAMAYFRHLDEDCQVSPLPAANGVEADYGAATLVSLRDGEAAQVRYSFTLNTGDVVEGEIEATSCAAPALFENPTALIVAEVDPDACR